MIQSILFNKVSSLGLRTKLLSHKTSLLLVIERSVVLDGQRSSTKHINLSNRCVFLKAFGANTVLLVSFGKSMDKNHSFVLLAY